MKSELSFDVPEQSPDAPEQNYVACPEPGLHHDVPFDTYASWQAVNSGVVKYGLKSPKHFHAALMGEIKSDDTKDRKLGRAIHARLLEPDTFKQRFIVAGPCAALLESGKRKGQSCGLNGKHLSRTGLWFCGKHGDESACDPTDTREIVTEDDVRRCEGVIASLKNLDPDLRAMLSRPGWSETSIVYEHEGMKLKGRMDRYSEGKRPCVLDVKKMQVGAGDRLQCQKAILNYGYAIQAAIYVKGVEAITGKRPEFCWVFVEDNAPFDIQIVPADEQDIDIGWQMVRQAIRMYRDAGEDRYGYIRVPENVKPGGLPAWFVNQWQEKQGGI